MSDRHMVPETSTADFPHEALKSVENGVTLPHVNTARTVERPSSNTGLYTSNVKDPGEIKSPRLPLGENVAVATAAAGGR